MKKQYILAFLLALALQPVAWCQKYSFRFAPKACNDTVLYVASHYRDQLQFLDSAHRDTRRGEYHFRGTRQWPRGVYALVGQDRKTVLTDFLVDDSRSFSISGDLKDPQHLEVRGSVANQQMYLYLGRLAEARAEQARLQQVGDSIGMDRLDRDMSQFESEFRRTHADNLFVQLVHWCEAPTVPDAVMEKGRYYRIHYWDALFETLGGRPAPHELLYSPQLFNKMNYFFFGLLYHSDSDTISLEVDRLMLRIGTDTALARYVLQFIEPRYYRSTRNIGWDAVWCHLVEKYYQKGRCPWAKQSELYVMNQNYKRVSRSIIGKPGAELWMMDTTQIDAPEHWHSSHRQPARYVILWFWDPDCHHCQEQSAALKILYDSLQTADDHRFEVYAVGYDSDVEKWRRYVREHEFHFVNVGGSNVNIDYQEAYNVHGAPTMIILNERREIIMNKVLPAKSVLPFLDAYERQHEQP